MVPPEVTPAAATAVGPDAAAAALATAAAPGAAVVDDMSVPGMPGAATSRLKQNAQSAAVVLPVFEG